MATIDDIISRAQQVRDNTAIGSNTATLVGGVMTDTAEQIKDVTESVSALDDELNGERLHLTIETVSHEQGAIRGGTGAEYSTSVNVQRTDYIDVSRFSEITFQGVMEYQSGQVAGYSFYSAKDTASFVSGSRFHFNTSLAERQKEVYNVQVPNGAKYFRTTIFVLVNTDWYLDAENGNGLEDRLTALESSALTSSEILQTTGNDATKVMSQDAVTRSIASAKTDVDNEIVAVNAKIGNVPNLPNLNLSLSDVTWVQGGIRGGTGVEVSTSAAVNRSDYIDVEGYGSITFEGILSNVAGQTYGYSFYSSNNTDSFVSGQRYDVDTGQAGIEKKEYSVQVPNGAKYFRLCIWVAVNTDWYLTAGGYLTDLQTQIDDLRGGTQSPLKKGDLFTKPCDVCEWYECKETTFSEGFSIWGVTIPDGVTGGLPTYAELISLYDSMLSDATDYMSRKTLGTASGTDGGGNSYTLYEYILTPRKITSDVSSKRTPVVCIDAGVHGHERNAIFALYYLIKDIVYRSTENSILEYYRNNVEIHFIPCANPYGFDQNIYVNGNGVNINRNFPAEDWEIVTTPPDQSTGSAPLDQPESSAISTWLTSLQGRVTFHLTLHTNGARTSAKTFTEANPHMIMTEVDDDYYRKMYNAIHRHIISQTYHFESEFNLDVGTSVIGRFQPTNHVGIEESYMVKYKDIMSMCFEMMGGVKDASDVTVVSGTNAMRMATEMLGNWIAELLKEYA